MDGAQIDGKVIRVQYTHESKNPYMKEISNNVFLRNIKTNDINRKS